VTTPPPPDHETVHVTLPAPSADGPVDGVALVVLDRPKVLNALDFALIAALTDVLEALDRDPACRAIVLTGAGDRAFAAGADIPELAAQSPTSLTAGSGSSGSGSRSWPPFAASRSVAAASSRCCAT
jgi:enoyl-CoA hydratase/carnithine racemase